MVTKYSVWGCAIGPCWCRQGGESREGITIALVLLCVDCRRLNGC
jgi:hypothetical protein